MRSELRSAVLRKTGVRSVGSRWSVVRVAVAALVLLLSGGCTARPGPHVSVSPSPRVPVGTVPGRPQQTVVLTAVVLVPPDPMPGGQPVELRNDSDRTEDLRCWSLRSLATQRVFYIVIDQPLEPGHSIGVLAFDNWLQSTDQIELIDAAGRRVDQTPRLTPDPSQVMTIWYRDADGHWQLQGPSNQAQPNGGTQTNGRLSDHKPAGC
jgi:hypothetical protein